MAKTDLTESSFGFAYAFELTTLWKNRLIAPYIPSLIEEGRRGGGYDVALNTRRLDSEGFLYYAQFKLSEFMIGHAALEARGEDGYNLPYYRFPIRPHQHKLLLELEDFPNALVEYVAPLFTSHDELSVYFEKGDLRSRVVRAIPSTIKLPDDKRHRVVCDRRGNHKKRYSEPVELESPSDWGEITEEGFERRPIRAKPMRVRQESMHDNSQTQRPTTVREQLMEFTHTVIAVLETSRMEDPKAESLFPTVRSEDVAQFDLRGLESDPVGTAQKMSRILLGAELFVFSDREEIE